MPCPPECIGHKWTARRGGRRRFSAAVCTATASVSLGCRGSATSSSRSTAAGGAVLLHEAAIQLARRRCIAARHRMRERLRPRATSLRFLAWKTRRRLALRRCLEFGDVEGASALGSSGRAVRAGRADCGARGGTAAGERRVGAACTERFPASRANMMIMPPTRTSSAPARFARRSTRRRSCSVTPCRRAARPTAPAWQRQRRRRPWQKSYGLMVAVVHPHNIQLTPQKLSEWRKNHAGAPGASVWSEDQKRHRGGRKTQRLWT